MKELAFMFETKTDTSLKDAASSFYQKHHNSVVDTEIFKQHLKLELEYDLTEIFDTYVYKRND